MVRGPSGQGTHFQVPEPRAADICPSCLELAAGEGLARGKAGRVDLASSCDVLGLGTCGGQEQELGKEIRKRVCGSPVGWKRLLPGGKACTCPLAAGLGPLAQALRDPRLSVQ